MRAPILAGATLAPARFAVGALIVSALGLTGGCDRPSPGGDEVFVPLVAFDTAAIRIETPADTFRLTVEIAGTNDQRAYGLMERPSLPEDHGMLFVYDEVQPGSAGFWMYRTLIPLDIAYIDTGERIVAILPMDPCGSPNPAVCRLHPPGVPYLRALEVNRGHFARRGIGVGDRVVLLPE